jgi:hypothetical protein
LIQGHALNKLQKSVDNPRVEELIRLFYQVAYCFFGGAGRMIGPVVRESVEYIYDGKDTRGERDFITL